MKDTYTDVLDRVWPEQPKLFDAVCRNLEIIDEASTKLGQPYRSARPEIAWRTRIGARNILAHAYSP